MVDVVADRVIVELRAKLDQFNRDTIQAEQNFDRATDAMVNDAISVESQTGSSFNRAGQNVARFGKNVSVARQHTTNIAAQFSDIGVQLAGGQSPFLIALQQGTQLNQVFNHLGGPRGIISSLGSAFLALLNPVSLATLGVIAFGGTAVQYLLQVVQSSEKTEKALEKQAQVVHKVAEEWGGAFPAIKAYSDRLKQIESASDLATAKQTTLADSSLQVKKELDALNEALTQIALTETGFAAITPFESAFSAVENYRDAIEKGEDATDELEKAQIALADALQSDVVNGSQAAQTAIGNLLAEMTQLLVISNQLNSGKGNRVGRQTLDEAQEQFNALLKFNRRINPEILPQDNKTDTPNSTKNNQERANSYERLTRRIADSTAMTVAETEALRQLDPLVDDHGYALKKASTEQDLLNVAMQAGLEITPQLRTDISSLAEQYALAAAESDSFGDAQREVLNKAMELRDFQKDLTRDIVDGFTAGKDAADIFADALTKIGNKLLDLAFDDLFGSGNNFGIFGNLLGSIFGGGSSIPAAASGTDYHQGGRILVGEQGPEIVDLPRGSRVWPNGQGVSGGPSIIYSPSYQIGTGVSQAEIAAIRQTQEEDQRSFAARVVATYNDQKRRGRIQP